MFTSTSKYTTLKRKAQDTVDMSVGIAGAAVQAVNWQRQKLTAIFTIIPPPPFIFRRGDLSSLKFSDQKTYLAKVDQSGQNTIEVISVFLFEVSKTHLPSPEWER